MMIISSNIGLAAMEEQTLFWQQWPHPEARSSNGFLQRLSVGRPTVCQHATAG